MLVQNSNKCYRCGSFKHIASSKLCPALSSKCHNCNRVGHFSRVCKSKKGRRTLLAERDYKKNDVIKEEGINEIHEIEEV